MTESASAETAMYECHGHIFMDGEDFRLARQRHADSPDVQSVRNALTALQTCGCVYFRDGGDSFGVSLFARSIAPEYGIEFVTPAFAVYREGLYGGIVGRSYSDMNEFKALLNDLKTAGADFLKLIVSGIITFNGYGKLSCEGLTANEIRELISMAHGEGFKVMVHANGAETVTAAATADSIEHGYFCDEASLAAMADNGCIWVPTLAAVDAFRGRPGFDCDCVSRTLELQRKMIMKGLELGITVAPGSDSGAFGVYHGKGTHKEFALLGELGIDREYLNDAAVMVQKRFKR